MERRQMTSPVPYEPPIVTELGTLDEITGATKDGKADDGGPMGTSKS